MANDLDFLITVRTANIAQSIQQIGQMGQALQQFGNVTVNVKPAMDNATKSSTNLAGALAGLTSRALLTIPVWMTLREAFMGGIRAFDESVKSIVDIDTAMKHLEMQLIGTKNAAQILAQVKISAQNLAVQTGENPASLIDVYNQLVTVGFDVQTAFQGMNTAAKGALATNSESKDIASVLINVYKELGNSITAVHAPADKLNYIMDTMTVLMSKNHLTIDDFESSLKSFAGQAAASGLTLDQTMATIAALANVSQTGTLGGRGLTGVFRQISLQPTNVEDFLGKNIGSQSQFQTFQDVLAKVQQISSSGESLPDSFSKIFSMRGGGQSIRALAEDAGKLTDNLKLLYSLSPDDRQAVFMGRLSIAQAELKTKTEQASQTILLLGRNFIEGVVGTDDYGKALSKVNQFLVGLTGSAKGAGEEVRKLGEILLGVGAVYASSGLLTKALPAIGANPLGAAGLAIGGLGAWATSLGMGAFNNNTAAADLDSQTKFQQFLMANNAARKAKGLAPVGVFAGSSSNVGAGATGPTGVGPTDTGDTDVDQAAIEQKKTIELENQQLQEKQLEQLGYNKLEILTQEYDKQLALKQVGSQMYATEKARLDVVKELNDEAATASDSYLKSAGKGISDLFMGDVKVPKGSKTGPLGVVAGQLGTTYRQGYASAAGDNIAEQLFGKTGIAQMFGVQTTAVRHLPDDPTYQGAYKGTFDGTVAAHAAISGAGTGSIPSSAAVAASASSPVSTQLAIANKFFSGGGALSAQKGFGGATGSWGSSSTTSSVLDFFTGAAASSGNMSTMAWPGATSYTAPNSTQLGTSGWTFSMPGSSSASSIAKTGSALSFLTGAGSTSSTAASTPVMTGVNGEPLNVYGQPTGTAQSLFNSTNMSMASPSAAGWISGGPSPSTRAGGTSLLASSSSVSVAKTGTNPLSSAATSFNKMFGINTSGNGPVWTLPGFGSGGFMQQNLFGGGNGSSLGDNGWTLSAGGTAPSNTSPFSGPVSGLSLTGAQAVGSLFQGFSQYESLGGSSGSMALPSSILGTAGSLAMAAGQPEIGVPLEIASFISGLFNKTSKTTTQTSTHQIASKLDESNKQLTMINRNLVAMKSSIDTYIMPNSAYFATKGNLSDQFAIDAQRGGAS